MIRLKRGRALAVAGALIVATIAGAIALERSRKTPPASPQVLERMGAKNEEAATAAAARMKAESEAATRAADARLGITPDNESAAPDSALPEQ